MIPVNAAFKTKVGRFPEIKENFTDVCKDDPADIMLRKTEQLAEALAEGGSTSPNRAVQGRLDQLRAIQVQQIEKKDRDAASERSILRLSQEELRRRLNERAEELNALADRYARNAEARNQILEMIVRGENPFLKDSCGRYVYRDLLFDKESGAGYSENAVSAMEGLPQEKRKIAAERGVNGAREAEATARQGAREANEEARNPQADQEALRKKITTLNENLQPEIKPVELDDLMDAPTAEQATGPILNRDSLKPI